MGYSSRRGRRPQENASKSSHSYIVNDPTVIDFLHKCDLPKMAAEISLPQVLKSKVENVNKNPINYVIAIDGGYSEVFVRKEFPSSTITFFQFGVLAFNVTDLEDLGEQPFIDPEDIAKLKNIQRLKLTIPTKNISLTGEKSLTDSVRRALYDFFKAKVEGEQLLKTLKWFIFNEYQTPSSQWNLATCPNIQSDLHNVLLDKNKMQSDFTFTCEKCGERIFLTDVFRLHEAIDDELGAGGILGYTTVLIEQMLLVHLLKVILNTKPSLLNEIIFIKDGPLAFFGQTANMHKPMRQLANFLLGKYNLYLAGLEKSGSFVDHADEIANKLELGEVLLLNNEYIYKYIIPSNADTSAPYARSSYYGGKLIYKARSGGIYVVTVPVKDEKVVLSPSRKDFQNLDIILSNIEKLRCDMYDSALIPVALVNKLVSLADHPSSAILERFAKAGVGAPRVVN